jgi:hypothetical protein
LGGRNCRHKREEIRYRASGGDAIEPPGSGPKYLTLSRRAYQRRICYSADMDRVGDAGSNAHLGSMATSSRSHLRWCFHTQPPVTEPWVIARTVPLTQIAA